MYSAQMHTTVLHSRFSNCAPNTRVLTSQGSRIEALFGAAGGCSEMSVCSTFGKIWSCRSQWYRDCTKALFVSKGSYGYGEPKKVIAFVGAINALAVMSRQSTQFLAAPNRADNENYIFRLSIPVSSFWYRHCFGANTVPWWWSALISSNFNCRLYTALHGTR